ncbi:MAG: FIG01129137: hypothetical protein, partial [uncultured Corynebacteriales bacterium]
AHAQDARSGGDRDRGVAGGGGPGERQRLQDEPVGGGELAALGRHHLEQQRRLHQPLQLHLHVVRADQLGHGQRGQDPEDGQRVRGQHHRRHRDRARQRHLQPLERLQGRHREDQLPQRLHHPVVHPDREPRRRLPAVAVGRRQHLLRRGQPLGHPLLL